MSSSVLESSWREGLSMDSSIFSDDEDCIDWRWSASSPRRCDRERLIFDTEYPAAHQNMSSCSCNRSSSNLRTSNGSMDENFFYCTEELGSESTCGSLDPCISAPDKGTSSSPSISAHSSLQTSADSFAPHHHHHHHHHQYYSAAFRHGHDCTFPPPIASLLTDRPLMQSFKSNGRFILKKVANVSCSLFRATRSNGCLRLDLLLPSLDRFESQQGPFSPASEDMPVDAESSSISEELIHNFRHSLKSNVPPYHLLSSPSPYSIFLQQRKPILNYAALCLLFKLQAFAMLVNPRGACCSVVEKSDTAWEAGQRLMKEKACGPSAPAMVHQSRLRVFALLKVLPRGLGLIIFEVGGGKVNGGAHMRVHSMCILETSSGAECGTGAATLAIPSHDHLIPSNSGMGASVEDPKQKLSPLSNEGCRRERYRVKGVLP